ncbi:MAG: hypothetical protein AMS24_00730 [Chlamydiae bacterium SM23_39]|nr:MAG: hypothetical protein AMS24_00730 [Chlamydiae bacterium SM23_39]
MKYKLKIAYDGSSYHGWQIQKQKPSIQGEIQKALYLLLKENISVIGAGRTDAKAHALCQVAHFFLKKNLDLTKTLSSLNGILPKDIRILNIEKALSSFHARFSSLSKTYNYYISTSIFSYLFKKKYTHFIKQNLNLSLMRKGAKLLLGTHDFSSFANKNSNNINPLKTLTKLNITKKNSIICFELTADGFLYKMVRNIVGTLVDLGRKKITIKDLDYILKAKDRKKASNPLPAHALFLINVEY